MCVCVTKWCHAAHTQDGSTIVVGSKDSKLYGISASKGTTLWTFSAQGQISSSAAIDAAGDIYVGSDDGNLYHLSSSGALVSSFASGNGISGSPSIGSNGVVYFGSLDANVYALK
jgi:outer membrane protein assembly factor BamB